MVEWHAMSLKDVLEALETSENGLSGKQVEEKRLKYGLNELKEKKKTSPLQMFLRQFEDFLIIILLASALVSFLIGETTDAAVIAIIVILNSVLGFVQEYRAEKAMEALKKLSAPRTRVIRDGEKQEISSRELVPGDIILLEEGDKIPADARILEQMNLQVQEAALTGESLPVEKDESLELSEETAVAERKNMVFMGTIITYGHAKVVVTGTGMSTELGKIAEMIQTAEEKQTPLQKKLDTVGKKIGKAILVICGIVFIEGILRGGEPVEMFMTGISLAVAAVPEGLPAVVTITLAIGLQRMIKRHALIRRLPAVETLGAATVICSDKTGTLTRNEMTVTRIFSGGNDIEVSGSGYVPEGDFSINGEKAEVGQISGLSTMLEAGALCNNSSLVHHEDSWRVFGDPTEGCLVVSAEKAGISHDKLVVEQPRIGELSFDSVRKMMSTVNKKNEQIFSNVKGAPELVLPHCDKILIDGEVRELSDEMRQKILDKNTEMAQQALRVLAVAHKQLGEAPEKYSPEVLERGLVFLGLAGMIDPPRKTAKKAIEDCKSAHIKVVMITGDHKLTAVAVAKELGLLDENSKVLTGEELSALSEEEFGGLVEDVRVYARVSPEHKVRIVDALKKNGHMVAMTGDGVNDAPALKKADIGVAMGITGTDVSKEASDMILTDDNFASIVHAVEEGRGIYDNIRKFIHYLLSCNAGEVLTIFVSMLMNLPLPLLPVQILWMNLVTDGLPALALGMEPGEKDIMKRPPRDPKEEALSGMSFTILGVGILITVGTLSLFAFDLETELGLNRARTIAFTTIIMFQMFNVFNSKSESNSLFSVGVFSNKWLILAVASSVLLHAAILYVPFFQNVFRTVPLSVADWVVIVLVSSFILWVVEARKYAVRKGWKLE